MKRLLFIGYVVWLYVTSASAQVFRIDTISDAVFLRMQGKSYRSDCTVPRSDLRYMQVSHYDKDGVLRNGEIVCNKLIANDLLEIFKELYRNRYPIERMRLVDDYDGDDEQSMRANNTSCFNFRTVAGSAKLSAHSRGMAIDINPLYNPCVRRLKNGTVTVQPATARQWADRRQKNNPYKIEQGDLCHRLFLEHGFVWGGSWRSLKDYQHFER
jgi:hypothetical protein